ncbi:MAG TPA: hypothetical protein VMA74_10770, partial [Dyella sp.]|uniref:hypothetical protein n=1 Tax=Dyella sp. TaxID=1869338 RepID=UPI002C31CB27
FGGGRDLFRLLPGAQSVAAESDRSIALRMKWAAPAVWDEIPASEPLESCHFIPTARYRAIYLMPINTQPLPSTPQWLCGY